MATTLSKHTFKDKWHFGNYKTLFKMENPLFSDKSIKLIDGWNVNEKSDRDSEPPSEQLVDTIARYRKKLPLSTTTTNEEMVLKNIQ
ncbi:unnamed protein product [Rhizophagus irregularis]|uniref:Uncharacterized protein n=1 Tax=Rhizophagus irregularis TaxID=588596 RepID=A0A916E692_9GLOM|nr:unnamed protein product [Rhizophagus irregularis]CAB5365602.1 unnamed protein product [Rhizophagus irregularis]